ncbi:MAG: 4Fe-4S dicluster domain-containing protein [Chloroflexi bacterium]|nr:4Fe-4S dicluster domain-containing protein [Chloroflexota bacterium]
MLGVLKGLALTWKTTWRKPVTLQYPDERLPVQPRFWGFPGLLWDDATEEPFCTGCQVCMRYCPTSAIRVTMRDNPRAKDGQSKRRKMVEDFHLNLSRCIACNICVEVCNFDAIEMTWQHEQAGYAPDIVADLPMLFKFSVDKRRQQKEQGAAQGS